MELEVLKAAVVNCFPAVNKTLLKNHVQKTKKIIETQKSCNQSELRQALRNIKPVWIEMDTPTLLHIFPEEIWLRILKSLDAQDQANCATACKLFQEWLIFPVILPNIIGFLSCDDILNCIRAFPEWRLAILSLADRVISGFDYFVESQQPFQNHYKIQKTQIDKEFLRKYIACKHINIPAQNGDIPTDKFPNVVLSNRVTVEINNHRQVFTMFANLLERKGTQFRHLTLIGGKINISPAMVYMLCHQIFYKCRNLKSLTIRGWNCLNWNYSEETIIQSIMTKPSLVNHSHLEILDIDVISQEFLIISNLILNQYKNQLKKVNVKVKAQPCYFIYEPLHFENLTEFTALQGNESEILSFLTNLRAPNLQKLEIKVDNYVRYLYEYITLLTNYSKLHCLHLHLGEMFKGWNDHQVLNIDPELCAKVPVKCLRVSPPWSSVYWNFLICFPHLRELIFGYTPANAGLFAEVSYQRGNVDMLPDNEQFGNGTRRREITYSHEVYTIEQLKLNYYLNAQQSQITSKKNRAPTTVTCKIRQHPTNLISKIPKCSSTKFEDVYNSNIWDFLKSLQIIQWDKYTYTRGEYERQENIGAEVLQEAPPTQKRLGRLELIENIREMREEIYSNIGKRFTNAEAAFLMDIWTPDMGSIEDLEEIRNGKMNFPLVTIILDETKTQRLFQEVFPIIQLHLQRNSVLSCRGVCKKWQAAVDSFLLENMHKIGNQKDKE